MNPSSKLLLLLAPLALACGKRGEEPCQATAPAPFDFVIFDENGRNYAENIPRTFNLWTQQTRSYVRMDFKPGPRAAYISSVDIPQKSLDGEKTFILAWGLESKTDTLFVDLVAGEGCAPPRYQAVRLNGKSATFEYGIGPNGAFVFRK